MPHVGFTPPKAGALGEAGGEVSSPLTGEDKGEGDGGVWLM